jgi:hypothetical protein
VSPGRSKTFPDDPIRTVIRVSRHLLLLAALFVLALPWGEAAATPFQVIKDCNEDGKLDGKYSNSELRKALENLPTDIDEYSDCREVIGAAITSGSKGGGNDGGNGENGGGAGGNAAGGGGGGTLDPNSPEEQAARAGDQAELDALTSPGGLRDKPPAVDVGGQTVKPGSDGLFDLASASNSVPLPLLLTLIVLGLLALGAAVVGLRGRIPAMSRIPLLSKLPTPRVSLPRFGRR